MPILTATGHDEEVRLLMAPDSQLLDNVVAPDPAEGAAMQLLHKQVGGMFQSGYRPALIGPDGERLELPVSAFRALALVVRGMAAGQTMTLMPVGTRLTTQQAAELLHVSRPHLVKLLDGGEIPYEKVGTHRRVCVEDILAYRTQRTERRGEQLRELSQLSQDVEGEYR
jgi:excisionase family DNA binding protein